MLQENDTATFGPETGCQVWGFYGFPQSFEANNFIVTKIMPQLLPSSFYPIQ
jgi:hypothetical protein